MTTLMVASAPVLDRGRHDDRVRPPQHQRDALDEPDLACLLVDGEQDGDGRDQGIGDVEIVGV